MHECHICHKVFPRPSGLSTHMNSHSGDKPFKCPIPTCDKHFTVRSNAKRHLRTHRSLSPSDPIFGGSSSGASSGDIEFDAPVVTEVHESGPKRLRWTRPSVSLRPISELVTKKANSDGRVWGSPPSQASDGSYDMDDGRDDEMSASEMTD
ncbi:hypothetical protein NEOLEDRAFT_1092293 [Neolentinus lepideus HHB14362 ss-1]|uniref:C2H2-type domain-containing protein n=1 Tax=Neolentinus lepideus HHB14362 ss-1 TaxID=1314782 RepID=A0A165SW07_9AGAM|nr:hypothetical protein NEOLEDRAFT_1092293 [Neolentinus lepideus HHB14362 ss-1]